MNSTPQIDVSGIWTILGALTYIDQRIQKHFHLPIYYIWVLSGVFSGLGTATKVNAILKAAFTHRDFVGVVI